MIKKRAPLREVPTFVRRTYRGGKLLREFLGLPDAVDSFTPEDWISSFTEAKNRDPIPGEGITDVLVGGERLPITEAVTPQDFGEGRSESGVLIKFLDAGERLGIQVHPTADYARKLFGAAHGKTECWHILATRDDDAAVYLGFKPHVTKELWRELFEKQDIPGMLAAMQRFPVKPGDTILVRGGTPHAIGAGCFLLEIQEPSDYTMRVEKITVAGEALTPMQIHYGAGEEALIDCFDYSPRTAEETARNLLPARPICAGLDALVTYEDTPCFRLDRLQGDYTLCAPDCVTVAVTADGGRMETEGERIPLHRGDKFFIPAGCKATFRSASALFCYPPEREGKR